MFEFSIVIAIVAVAGYFTIRKLVREARGNSCDSCACNCDISDQMRKIAEIADKNSSHRSRSA